MTERNRIKVGVLRGGPSNEYEVSLKTGGSILQNLSQEKYHTTDILIGKDGVWHVRGIPTEPAKILNKVDVVFNGLHGEYGEDGTVQNLLDIFGVSYTGSKQLASAVAMNKSLTKEWIQGLKIQTPRHEILRVTDGLEERIAKIFKHLGPSLVVKPLTGGSSVDVVITENLESLLSGIYKAFEHSPQILIEECIEGREATCGVIENFRSEKLYTTLPTEIVPPSENSFYDYQAKYESNNTQYILPGNFSEEEKEKIQQYAREVHRALGLSHYSRSDFIVSPRGIYFLEVNTLPGFTSHSLIPKAMEAVGCSFPDFLDHIIGLAHNRK